MTEYRKVRIVLSLSKAKKVGATFNSAYRIAAKKRRHAAYRFWKKGKTFEEVGVEFGVSKQRASILVRKAMSELDG